MTKMAVKRTGIIEKHCSTFPRLFNGFYPEAYEVYINLRSKEGRIGICENKNCKNCEIGQISAKVSSSKTLYAHGTTSVYAASSNL